MIVALPRSPDVSVVGRDAVLCFADRLGAERTADACLLVSELVTNAYTHGAGQIQLSIALDDQTVRFAVHDDGDASIRPTPCPDHRGGWGLNIVQQVADRWGTGRAPTCVWFELRCE